MLIGAHIHIPNKYTSNCFLKIDRKIIMLGTYENMAQF
jgi:hypothetical protein